MLNFSLYLLIGLLISSIFSIFYSSVFYVSAILFYLFIYVLALSFFVLLHFDLVGILLVLIYGGGVLVLIMFSVYLLNLQKVKITINLNAKLFLGVFGVMSLIFFNFFSFFSNLGVGFHFYTPFLVDFIFYTTFIDSCMCELYFNNCFLNLYLFELLGLQIYLIHLMSFISLTCLLFLSLLGVVLVSFRSYMMNSYFLLANLNYTYLIRNTFFLLPNIDLHGTNNSLFYLQLLCLFGSLLFILSFTFLILSSDFNVIKLLLAFELMYLSTFMFFAGFSFLLDDISGIIFILYSLGIMAAETALGLAIYLLGFYFFKSEVKFKPSIVFQTCSNNSLSFSKKLFY